MKTALPKIVALSTLFGSIVALAALQVFVSNPIHFPFRLGEVLFPLGMVTAGVFLLSILITCAVARWRETWLTGSLCFGTCLWTQANLLLWNVPMTGDPPGCKDYTREVVAEFLIFAAIVVLFYRYRKFFGTHLVKIACILIAAPILLFIPTLIDYSDDVYDSKMLVFSDEGKFDFSTDSNLVIFVLDSFEERIFEEIRTSDDGRTNREFKDFTHLSGVISENPWTIHSVPPLLSGTRRFVDWENGGDIRLSVEYVRSVQEAFREPCALPAAFHKHGYENRMFPHVSQTVPMDPNTTANVDVNPVVTCKEVLRSDLLPYTCYRIVPFCVKRPVFHKVRKRLHRHESATGDDDELFFAQMGPRMRTVPGKQFRHYHLHSVHSRGDRDEYDFQEYVVKGASDLAQTARFLELLKEHGAYDNSYILILGDHGNHHAYEHHYLPFAILKKPGETHAEMVEFPETVLMSDFAPTILGDFGFLPENLPDENRISIWNLTEKQKAERRAIRDAAMQRAAQEREQEEN